MKIIFGDSISLGCWGASGGWADMLKKHFSKQEEIVYNLSIDGATVHNAIYRMEEIEHRLTDEEPVDIIIALGVNDTAYHSLATFQRRYEMLVSYIRVCTKDFKLRNIYCIGLTQVDEKHSTPVSWDDHLNYLNGKISSFDNSIRLIAEAKKCQFINVWLTVGKKDLHDGVHPNSNGHKKMFRKIIKAIK